jgi:hypothetical protein
MRIHVSIASLVLILCLAGCGGGSGDSGGGTPPPASGFIPAPSGLSYPAPPTYVVAQPIPNLSPTVNGTVASYSVAPTLPVGLSLNAATGQITGTPTAPSAQSTYTVTAINSSGSTTVALSITVIDVAPVVTYGKTHAVFTTGVPVNFTPANSGGAALAWSIDPALPAGLRISATTGAIIGTPNAVTSPRPHVVTATNSGGSDTFALTIEVDNGVLVNLGHGNSVPLLRHSGTRVLSADIRGHWVLWNSQTGALLAQGDLSCSGVCDPSGDIAGNTFVIGAQTTFEVRAVSDGHLLSTFPSANSWWKLAFDGSYVATGTAAALTVRAPDGTLVLQRLGNYSKASAFAAAGEIRYGGGPAGANVVETIAVPSGTSTLSAAFQGNFHGWFVNGERFLSRISDTVWVYTRDVTQLDLRALPSTENLTGQGDWFWVYRGGSDLDVYEVGASAAPAASYNFGVATPIVLSKDTVTAVPHGIGQISVVDLSGATPVRTDRAAPMPALTGYVAISGNRWLVSNRDGVVADIRDPANTPMFFGYGAALSIATSAARAVVATASGKILVFDSDTRQLEREIDFFSSRARLSADGTVLVAAANDRHAQFQTDRSVNVYQLPAGTVLRTVPYTYAVDPVQFDISLSESGDVLGTMLYSFNGAIFTIDRKAEPTLGGAPIWSDSYTGGNPTINLDSGRPIRLSPDGTAIAVPDREAGNFDTATQIALNGTLTTAAAGWAVGWIDDQRLLLNRYETPNHIGPPSFSGTAIVNRAGTVLASPALPEMKRIQRVTPSSVYSPELNAIHSLTDGAALWTSANPATGAGGVTATHVVFTSGATVRIEPHELTN